MLYVSIKSSSAARNANDNALEIYLSDLLIRHWMKYWKECRRRGRGGCTRIIGICNEHVKMNKNRQISLEILWRHKCTVSSFLSPLRKGSVNLERFHYLRKHFSVGFFLMNINGESEKGYFFSLLPLFFFCLFSFTFHREIVQRALNKPDLRGTWCARTTSASEYSRGTGWRINIFFFVRWLYTALTLAKSIFNVQQPEYMSAPWSVSFALVADSTESNVIIERFD